MSTIENRTRQYIQCFTTSALLIFVNTCFNYERDASLDNSSDEEVHW